MAGRGRVPKEPGTRRNRSDVPQRGEWQALPGIGWQHGAIPDPPDGLLKPSQAAWQAWFRAWFASHWTPADLPGLRKVILLYDATERGELHRSAELRMGMDGYGITPKGQQDRRWQPPKADDQAPTGKPAETSARYGNLRAI